MEFKLETPVKDLLESLVPEATTKKKRAANPVDRRVYFKALTRFLAILPEDVVSVKEQEDFYKSIKKPGEKLRERTFYRDKKPVAYIQYYKEYVHGIWSIQDDKHIYGMSIGISENIYLDWLSELREAAPLIKKIKDSAGWSSITEIKGTYKYLILRKLVSEDDVTSCIKQTLQDIEKNSRYYSPSRKQYSFSKRVETDRYNEVLRDVAKDYLVCNPSNLEQLRTLRYAYETPFQVTKDASVLTFLLFLRTVFVHLQTENLDVNNKALVVRRVIKECGIPTCISNLLGESIYVNTILKNVELKEFIHRKLAQSNKALAAIHEGTIQDLEKVVIPLRQLRKVLLCLHNLVKIYGLEILPELSKDLETIVWTCFNSEGNLLQAIEGGSIAYNTLEQLIRSYTAKDFLSEFRSNRPSLANQKFVRRDSFESLGGDATTPIRISDELGTLRRLIAGHSIEKTVKVLSGTKQLKSLSFYNFVEVKDEQLPTYILKEPVVFTNEYGTWRFEEVQTSKEFCLWMIDPKLRTKWLKLVKTGYICIHVTVNRLKFLVVALAFDPNKKSLCVDKQLSLSNHVYSMSYEVNKENGLLHKVLSEVT
jgi:hypothetical protein